MNRSPVLSVRTYHRFLLGDGQNKAYLRQSHRFKVSANTKCQFRCDKRRIRLLLVDGFTEFLKTMIFAVDRTGVMLISNRLLTWLYAFDQWSTHEVVLTYALSTHTVGVQSAGSSQLSAASIVCKYQRMLNIVQ